MSYVSEADTATFQQEVLDRSRQVPVLVDFWAEWCGPCRTLGPLLEQVVQDRQGQVWLVKVDTDQNPELAQQFGIRGIPAVKAFVDGQLADEFVGALPRAEVEAFVDRLCPSGEEQALERGRALLQQGQAQEVPGALQPALDSPHHREQALVLVARAQLQQRDYEAARAALEQLPEGGGLAADEAKHLRLRLELASAADGIDETRQRERLERHPEDLDARWALASRLHEEGRTEEALEQLLELLQRSRAYRDDGARRAILALLDELGPDSDLARSFRRQLQIYL
jgi:putative thioredoxin